MKHFSGIIITVLVITISCSNTGENEHQISQVELNDYMDTVSYSVGVDIGKSFRYQEMDIDPIVLAKGLDDAFNEKGRETSILAWNMIKLTPGWPDGWPAEGSGKAGCFSIPPDLGFRQLNK